MVWKCHHSLLDGISNILMYTNLTDNPKVEDLPPIMIRFSFFMQMLQFLLVPIYINYLNVKLLGIMDW